MAFCFSGKNFHHIFWVGNLDLKKMLIGNLDFKKMLIITNHKTLEFKRPLRSSLPTTSFTDVELEA